jgi:hypothetical protein
MKHQLNHWLGYKYMLDSNLASFGLSRLVTLMAGPILFLAASQPLFAQLNQNCTVSVLNRNVQAKADGTWVLPNIPANFGTVRARATCVEGGATRYGESAPFTIPANGSITLPPIQIGQTTPIPTSVQLTSQTSTLSTVGATAQLTATASYSNTSRTDNITTSAGTTYSVSNPAMATVTPSGLVTALKSGVVVVQATHEGTQGIVMIRVALSNVDSDGDGIPDDEELRLGLNPNNGGDALLDADHDGLTGLEEYQRGTDANNADSDSDGISDGDEAHCLRNGHCTNPLVADTDGDGVRDLLEIQTGSDPTSAASVNWARVISNLRVTPGNFTLVVNSLTGAASVQLTVLGTLIDGSELNLTSSQRQTTYASSNVASCNFGSPDGRVFASAAGACTITVSNNGHSATVSGAIQDFAPTQLAYLAIPGFANGVAVTGDYAFIASGSTGLQVVSLGSDRRNPTIVAALSLGASSNDITLAGNLAYLATTAGLKVVDISTPASPRLLGTFATNGVAYGVKVRGTTAYVAAGSGLQIVSVANPGAMIAAGSVSLGGTCWNLDLDPTRNLTAVACGAAGLKLVDVSNLSNPIVRGTAQTSDARGVVLRGDTAIVADYVDSMTSVDAANPASPNVLARTEQSLGGLLTNVVLSGNFAIGSDVYFVNGVPIVDVTNPEALAPRSVLNFSARDDNGMGLTVDSNFIYVVTDHSALSRGGSDGDGRLYIGQYQPRVDLAGVAPSVSISSPSDGNQVYEGAALTVLVDAIDDVAVAQVRFLVGGQAVFTTTAAPYQYTFTVPSGVSGLQLGAQALDLGGNLASAPTLNLAVAPDPLTRVAGLILDVAGNPVRGATVTAPGGKTSTTNSEGRFEIVGVPTVLGNIVVQAQATLASGLVAVGSSLATAPVLAGLTDVGSVTLVDAQFETNYGTFWTTADDTFIRKNLAFNFPFYGTAHNSVYVGTNGYITLNAGDSTYAETVNDFSAYKRISAFFDDLIGGGGVYINDQLPGRFVVTYDRTRHYSAGGSNTIQITLFQDGRIVFGFKGISALSTGSITGLTPGPDAPFQQVDFSASPTLDLPAGNAIYEYFTSESLFDLDNGFIVFTPTSAGGYSVRTIRTPTPMSAGVLATATPPLVAAAVQRRAVSSVSLARSTTSASATTPASFADAEVMIRSSSQLGWVGMVNTDERGRFEIRGVPAGGIEVTVRRQGLVIARGATVYSGGNLSEAQFAEIQLLTAETSPKGR